MSKLTWIYKNFEEYLQEMHMKEEPYVLDDDLPDAFSEWLCELDPDDMMVHADTYASIRVTKALEKVEEKLNETTT